MADLPPTHTQTRGPADAPPSVTGGETAAPSPPGPPPPIPLPPSDRPGDLGRLGRYRVRKQLGQGGMGAVFLGYDDHLRRKVALKVMLPRHAADPAARERFLREARSAANVRSDHVVTIHDVGEHAGAPFIAMEFLDGYPLDEFLRTHPRLTVPQVLRVGREAAAGLAAAHAKRLIHRDIKPANLWLEAPDGRVKILDFGLAKPVGGGDGADLTGSGAVVGTPAYMAPEQAVGEPADGRADLFSLGCVLYRLVTGQPPFAGPNPVATLASVLTQTPRPVWEFAPDTPPPLADLVHRLLAKDPARRPPSAAALADALAGIERMLARGELSLAEPVPVAQSMSPLPEALPAPIPVTGQAAGVFDDLAAGVPTPTGPRAARRGVWLVAGAAVVLAAGVAAFVAVRGGTPPPAPPASPVPPPPGLRAGPPESPREFAVRILTEGRGWVCVDGTTRLRAADQLPAGRVQLVGFGVEAASDNDVPRLLRPGTVEEVALAGIAVTETGIIRLTQFESLRKLSLSGMRVSGSPLYRFGRLPWLNHLVLSGVIPDEGAIGSLAGARIRDLEFIATPVTDADLKSLWLPQLETLNLSDTQVTPAGVPALRSFPELASLHLRGPSVTDAWVPPLAETGQLTSLVLYETQVSDGAVKALGRLPRLRALNFVRTPISDAAVRDVAAFPELRVLNLQFTRVTDAGVQAVAAGGRVTRLHLEDNPVVTDAGLRALADLKSLEYLCVQRTAVTRGGVGRFRRDRPSVTVVSDYDP